MYCTKNALKDFNWSRYILDDFYDELEEYLKQMRKKKKDWIVNVGGCLKEQMKREALWKLKREGKSSVEVKEEDDRVGYGSEDKLASEFEEQDKANSEFEEDITEEDGGYREGEDGGDKEEEDDDDEKEGRGDEGGGGGGEEQNDDLSSPIHVSSQEESREEKSKEEVKENDSK
ncbi:uncharacterized protein LOC129292347 [Prosopis cineraria]|uniref:uncharacterized protein LOC129292347 n=1 Tax=Prosopis cineraria TaxID=364024 RepID=UPI00240F8145|nr:uncharacterized protein LOC129292347 [Prosopis cineraria]